MRRHPFDITAFVWGFIFLVASIATLTSEWIDLSFDLKWLLPAGLVVIGVAGIESALRSTRR